MLDSEVRWLPLSPDPWGRSVLALLTGYLCSLCAFEWTLLWDFSPYAFRPVVALSLTLAFLASLTMHQQPRDKRAALAILALTWIAVAAWPLRLSPITATVFFSTLVLLSLLATLSATPRAGVALMAALGLALALLAGLPSWLPSLGLCAMAALEMKWLSRSRPLATSGRAAKARLEASADTRTAEISWKGFAALFRAAAPGEGERFTTTVLADTTQIIEGCGGRRIKGSDLNGIYRFPNETALDRCLDQLERYRRGIVEVLDGAQAPPLELIVSRL